eukprot:6325195-Amphidinium_carterae.1
MVAKEQEAMLSELRLRIRSDVLIGPRRLDVSSVLRAATFILLKNLEVECAMCVVAQSTQRRLPRKGPAKGGSGGGSGNGRQDPGGSRGRSASKGSGKGNKSERSGSR